MLEGLHGLIENGRSIENRDEEELRAGLYQQVGQLDVQGGYPKNYEAVPEAVPVQGGYNTFNNHERLHLKLGRRTPERISQ